MNVQAETDTLEDRQSILEAIHSLLEQSGGIDESRAKQVRKAVDALRKTGEGPADGADPPAEVVPAKAQELDATIEAGLETLRERVHRQVERRNRDLEKSLALLEEVETALRENELQHAEQAYHRLMSLMGNIPGLSEQRWQGIEERLNQVRPQLRKLESWRHWGTTQVRQKLIAQVRELKDTGLPPDQLAARIKAARAQWQTWDKSGDHAGKELWKEFDSACTEAYRPCAEHFKQLKQQRAENLRKRRTLIEQLNAHFESTDWKHPDWRGIDRFLQHARREFRNTGNVDFRHRKGIAQAFDAALEKFEDYLSRERERSLHAREKLIADVEALAGRENLREALDQLDTLKKQWVITIPGKRGFENRLWQRFQQACDSIYGRRDAERKQHDVERQENLARKQALVEELNRATTTADAELLANAMLVARSQEHWSDIGAVPRKEEARLEQQWRKAQQEFRKALAAAQSRGRASMLEAFVRHAALCQQWEQATLAGTPPDTTRAQAERDALPALDGSHAGAMELRMQQAFTTPDAATLADNLARSQDACLRLEVLLELPSPPQFQGARMAYQVERLNASLKKQLDAQESVEGLLYTALTTGAVPPDALEPLTQRLEQCLSAYRKTH